MKKILLLLMILVLVGCNVSKKKEVKKCTDNWAICMLGPNINEFVLDENPVKVAVLDSGINSNLNQLQGYVAKSFNTLDNSFKTLPVNEHGTMIASIITATNYDGKNIGLNKNVQLYDVQVLDDDGAGQSDNIVSGIDWAIKQNVDIINISYGFSNDDNLIRNAIKRAYENGIIIVAATGNTVGLTTDYPAKYPEVLSISAIDSEMNIFAYAGKGKVDYVAPGVNVPVLNIKGKLEYQSGTSFAAAYATGVVSILKLRMDNKAILEYLEKNSIELGTTETYGQGLIQIKEKIK